MKLNEYLKRTHIKLNEDLESDLKDKQVKRNEILNNIKETLEELDFEESKELNGVSYDISIEREPNITFKAQFYIDNTTFNYTAYITSDNGDDKFNLNLKGNEDGIENALNKFIEQFKIL